MCFSICITLMIKLMELNISFKVPTSAGITGVEIKYISKVTYFRKVLCDRKWGLKMKSAFHLRSNFYLTCM